MFKHTYFLQTPSFYTPIEPHFFFPFFQILPIKLRIILLQNFNLGYLNRTSDYEKAREIVESIQLLTKHELEELFPKSTIKKEKFLGFTLSYIVYHKNK